MSEDSISFMEIVSDTDADSTDTTVNSGHTDDEEYMPQQGQLLLPEVIRRAEASAGIENRGDDEQQQQPGATGGVQNVSGDDDDDDDDDATQPTLGAEADVESEKFLDHDVKPPSARITQHDMSSEEEGQMCTICFEPWTSSSEHRLVSLRCGHLFGRSCISKWLRGQGSRCPQCNARARKSEIRPIYARCLKVLDTSERDRALRDLEKESELRKKAELECAQVRLKYHMALSECELVKKELVETKRLLSDARSVSNCAGNVPKSARASPPAFTLSSVIDLAGGCRILDCDDSLDLMVVSQPSCNQIFKGYGLKKISVPTMRLCEYVHLHQKPIKDVSFHNHNGLVLTASLDKTLKLTNCLNNSMVQTYNLDCEAWSCTWDRDDPCYFYAGVRTGVVYLFDIRVTDRYVEQLSGLMEASPVISIQYIKHNPAAASRKCGPIISHLASCFYFEKLSSTCFERYQLPLEGRFTSLSYESNTRHLLASCRPSLKHPRVTHTLCSIGFEANSFQCNLVQSVAGGSTQAQLSRSKLMQHPKNESSVLICAGDEEAKSALIWDGSTGNLMSSLKADSPVLDMTTFRHDRGRTMLATLTEKNLRVYHWSQN